MKLKKALKAKVEGGVVQGKVGEEEKEGEDCMKCVKEVEVESVVELLSKRDELSGDEGQGRVDVKRRKVEGESVGA